MLCSCLLLGISCLSGQCSPWASCGQDKSIMGQYKTKITIAWAQKKEIWAFHEPNHKISHFHKTDYMFIILESFWYFVDWECRRSLAEFWQPSVVDILGVYVLPAGYHVNGWLWWRRGENCTGQDVHCAFHHDQHCKWRSISPLLY